MQTVITKDIFVIILNQFDNEKDLHFFGRESSYYDPTFGIKDISGAAIFDDRRHADNALFILHAPNAKVLPVKVTLTIDCSLSLVSEVK